jgi:hypothetical protein
VTRAGSPSQNGNASTTSRNSAGRPSSPPTTPSTAVATAVPMAAPAQAQTTRRFHSVGAARTITHRPEPPPARSAGAGLGGACTPPDRGNGGAAPLPYGAGRYPAARYGSG